MTRSVRGENRWLILQVAYLSCQHDVLAAATLCVGGPRKGRRVTKSRSVSPKTVRHSTCGELGTPEFLFDRRGREFWTEGMAPEFFGHRFQNSMTRATMEGSTASLGQTFRTRDVLWLVGYPSMTFRRRAGIRQHWAARRHSSPESTRHRGQCGPGVLLCGSVYCL